MEGSIAGCGNEVQALNTCTTALSDTTFALVTGLESAKAYRVRAGARKLYARISGRSDRVQATTLALRVRSSAEPGLESTSNPQRSQGGPQRKDIGSLDGGGNTGSNGNTGGSGGSGGTTSTTASPAETLKLALWTHRTAYMPGQTLRLYRTIAPGGASPRSSVVFYLERLGSAGRRYLAPGASSDESLLRPEPVDQFGLPADPARVSRLVTVERGLTWQGPAPSTPGLWQFVMELRKGSQSVEPQRMWAKFVVGPGRLLNRRGFVRNVTDDLTVDGGRVHYLMDRLVVRDGATLRLEPGALVAAFGPNAEIAVEPGGRIEASGTRQMPVVLTCTNQPGDRAPGCWGGLRIRGRAPVTGDGGDRPDDSSGWLRHVRIEFAGAGPAEGPATPALALHGVGSGTVLEHVQARSSAGDGIAFVGGTVGCDFCVASASGADGLSWERGWRGRMRQLYVWQGLGEGDAIDGRNLDFGPDLEPRSHPVLANVTLTTGASGAGWSRSKGTGLRLHAGTGLTGRQLLVHGFRGGAVVAGPRAGQLLEDGTSGVADSIRFGNLPRPLKGWSGEGVEFVWKRPLLRNAGTDPNHDPRPKRLLKAQEDPPGEADYVGAFGEDNWLEEWTVFGLESDYVPQNTEDSP